MYTDGRRELPRERLLRGLMGSSTPGVIPRAVIVEPHPALRAVLEYLLAQEGYAVEAGGEAPFAEPGPALLLVASEDGGGLYIFEAEKAAETLEKFSPGLPVFWLSYRSRSAPGKCCTSCGR